MEIESLKTEDLIPYARNARTHSEAQVTQIAASIKEFGFNNPILIDESGGIIAGHGRVMAAQKLKLESVPCIRLKHLSPTQRKAYILADNKLALNAGWDEAMLALELAELKDEDFDLALIGFDEMELAKLAPAESNSGLTDPDDAPEPPEEPITKLGDIWQLENHRLMCGDSTDKATVDKLMDGKKADMVFTDPPYGVTYTGGLQFKESGQVVKDNREMIKNDETDSIYSDVIPIIASICEGPCYTWFAGTKASKIYSAIEAVGEIHSLIIWVKNGGYGALNANYKQKHEPCLYWKPKGKKLNFVGATTETTIWDLNKDGVNKLHPTQKPIGLAAKAINNHSAGLVADLFGGSGSTLIACEQLNRICYMMELDPKYCDVIIKRWEDYTGRKAVLINER